MPKPAVEIIESPVPPDPGAEPEVLAAVDLGSNSFHMVVARLTHGQLTVVDRLREMVRLAAGLDAHNRLDQESVDRALDCLGRFGERIRDMHADRVRVVGTNTLRKARKLSSFLDRAQNLLGHPVEIISGIEEARLIFLGVSHSMPYVDAPQLVVDIGGGSTEIVVGRGYEPELMESLYVGCVGTSAEFFGNGKLTARRFERARLAARLELEPVKARFRALKPQVCVGGSGSIRAARDVIRALEGEEAEVTVASLERLIGRMIEAGRLERLELEGLAEQRKPVFAGGIAILVEVMTALEMDRVRVADGALREGILYDLVGRLTDEDARQRTVRAMEARFHVDAAQADRVEATALALLDQVAERWDLVDPNDRLLLGWSARLHEIGLDIAHSHYHHHGAYLLEHADMPGFPRDEQRVLSQLVGNHRRSISGEPEGEIPKERRQSVMRMAALLRLAVLFNRSRSSSDFSQLQLKVGNRRLTIRLSPQWLANNPLSVADLERERKYLADAGFELRIEASDGSA